MYPINKREIPATPKIYDILEVLAARHLYFLKCSLLARKNKHTARMFENTRKDHLIPLLSFFI